MADGLHCGVSFACSWTMTCKCSVFLTTKLRRHSGCTGRCLRLRHSETMVAFLHGVGSHNRLCFTCVLRTSPRAFVSRVSDAERHLLVTKRTLPFESSAQGKRCVMCPVKNGSPKLIPCCLCNNRCHVPCSYQTHLGRICPCHIRIP